MFSELVVSGYQSLRHVSLKLRRFTIVTGATSSGKSSVIRAAQLVAFNARGTAYISHGSDKAQVGLYSDTRQGTVAVVITRGGRGQDSYNIEFPAAVPTGGYGQSGARFTKLAGQVPGRVSDLLHLTPLNFAGQFDRPYLLTESAGDVARALGQLTNVTLIFTAAREAGRRKLEVVSNIRAADAEIERLAAQLPRFASLPGRLQALRRAEQALPQTSELQLKADRLSALLSQYNAVQARLSQPLPRVPDLTQLSRLFERRLYLQELKADFESYANLADERSSYIEVCQARAIEAQQRIQQLLIEAGRCPTCGQEVHGVQSAVVSADASEVPAKLPHPQHSHH